MMSPCTVDLFVGSDIGFWFLENGNIPNTSKVITVDPEIYNLSENLGFSSYIGDANNIDFVPAEVGFSVHYSRILRPPLISRYRKIYNLHPGYLPWGRGFYPVFWALWEQTPAGATLHEVTEGVDEGAIVDQTRVEYYPHDTGQTLFERVRHAEKELALKWWPRILTGESLPSRIQCGSGTYHTKKEFLTLKTDPDLQSMSAQDLIRLIRSLTHRDFTGLELELGEWKFHIRLESLTL